MSAQLDKSLDEIISSNRPKKSIKKSNNNNKVGKNNTNKKQPKKPTAATQKAVKAAVSNPRAAATAASSDISFATKAIVHNLPKDIKQDDIKEFFQSSVGGVKTVALSYNEKGQSKGIATIVFTKSSAANKAFEKFNGAPIDNGAAKLRVELIVDPTKKPLSARVQANPLAAAVVAAKKGKMTPGKKVAAIAASNKKSTPKPKKAKPVKKPKKTVEDLDKEMADYFETK